MEILACDAITLIISRSRLLKDCRFANLTRFKTPTTLDGVFKGKEIKDLNSGGMGRSSEGRTLTPDSITIGSSLDNTHLAAFVKALLTQNFFSTLPQISEIESRPLESLISKAPPSALDIFIE